MIAWDDGDAVRRTELPQPVAGGNKLLAQRQIDEIAGHDNVVGLLSLDVVDQSGEGLIVGLVAAVPLPVDVAEHPFGSEVAPAHLRQWAEMQISQMGERKHWCRLIRGFRHGKAGHLRC